MSLQIRRSAFVDVPAARRLGAEAFGVPSRPQADPDPASWPAPNTRPWVATDGGEVVAALGVRRFTSWFHGVPVATAGLAGVTVAAERRGSGILRPLVDAALAEARGLGEVVSTLYPSSAGIYRGLGYEVVGSFDEARVPMAALAAVRPPDAVRTRRATAADVPAVRRVYSTWASAQNGPLTRAEAPFLMEPGEMVGPDADCTGVTLAVTGGAGGGDGAGAGDERLVGFVSWSRGSGYDRTGAVEVDDLVALTPDAARALWRLLGSFSAVVGEVTVATSGAWAGADVTRLVLPDHAATTTSRPYMLRLLDVPGALASARLAPVSARVPFAVVDPLAPDLEGAWTLAVEAGAVRVEADGHAVPGDRPTFTSAGLAQSYAGAQSCANLRLAGHLTGPTEHDAVWDALWGGRQVHVRDYF
ncbi:GNAT family N-acetyltransferase [Isoptericola sp. NEAU-Y5]|uniref:GNAT family N-acetyltransferase n=1 Tax=Isoptericola luteus TaxID=2879484 RepID=A0ABS7ZH06_9MICO|nr:GNAT family N-acetyltransferase [Isoptericola sp. NEAU-Y5]MCA5893727.1 GNAT family N-acetyltransferase [Isoptericola sp. NEAU-Y5]